MKLCTCLQSSDSYMNNWLYCTPLYNYKKAVYEKEGIYLVRTYKEE